MGKPALFAVDDDPQVLRAVERDLRQKYGKEYRVLRAESGEEALNTVKQLKEREETVALFVADQRMPGMSGVEFLEKAKKVFPSAKRTLLTAYADTDAAIRAINSAGIDYYLMKPWDPPDERLYPVLNDLLEDWQQNYKPAFEGVKVAGHRWSPEAHRIKDFLARNLVPYQWHDIEEEHTSCVLMEKAEAERPGQTLVVFPDGSNLLEPTNAQLAAKVGLRTTAEKPFYDLVIVGTGPRGAPVRDGGARSAGWAGRNQFADRELSRLSQRALRRRSHATGAYPGPAIRGGIAIGPGSQFVARRGPLSNRVSRRRFGTALSQRADLDGSLVQPPGCAGRGKAHRTRRVLWRGDERG
jgi:CheY-like chemotaxis protein